MIKHSMKKLFLLCMVSLGLYGSLFPQAPTESPIASPTATTAATAATAATSIAAPASTTSSRARSARGSRMPRRAHRTDPERRRRRLTGLWTRTAVQGGHAILLYPWSTGLIDERSRMPASHQRAHLPTRSIASRRRAAPCASSRPTAADAAGGGDGPAQGAMAAGR